MIRDGRLVDTAHLRSQKCAVSEANAQFCPLILPLTIQQLLLYCIFSVMYRFLILFTFEFIEHEFPMYDIFNTKYSECIAFYPQKYRTCITHYLH